MFKQHPKGLYILFFTEMWERFSYYGMRGILVLYLTASTINGGMGWDKADALSLYGTYTMMVYIMSIPGGILADSLLGQKKSVMLGGALLVAGHGIMSIPKLWAFYTALVLIILGVGALKANISTMVGSLYPQKDKRRDKGFYIFYMGINLGAVLAAVIVGYVGEKINWHLGFGLAGFGMLIGQIIYVYGQKYLKGVGELPVKKEVLPGHNIKRIKKIINNPVSLILTTLFILLGGYVVVQYSIINGALIAFGGMFLGAGITIYDELSSQEKDRVIVLLISFFIVIMFWAAFEQAGGLMNIFTKEKVNLELFGVEVAAAQLQSLNPLFILIFALIVAGFWQKRAQKGKENSAIFKMSVGNIIMGLGFILLVGATLQVSNAGYASILWIVIAYLFHTLGELCSSPVALSFITKLAPQKYASSMMGLYFAMTGLGNKLAGVLGGSAYEHFNPKLVFGGIGLFSVLFGVLLLLFLRKLKRLTHGAEDITLEEK